MGQKYIDQLKNEKILILGEGRSNKSVMDFLCDNDIPFKLMTNALSKKMDIDLEGITYIVKAPGIPHHVEFLEYAHSKGIYIVNEIEVGFILTKAKFPNAKIIGITGTNGKTTTVTLVQEMLINAGKKSILCGNIGKSFVEAVLETNECEYVVVELSSYQLKSIDKFRPDIAAITNITNDHIDFHLTMEDYIKSKENMMRNMTADDIVIREEDAEKVDLSFVKGIKPRLVGEHNLTNFKFMIAIGNAIGIDQAAMKKTFESAIAPEHRLEFVIEIGGVSYFNDSKATNIDATEVAVKSFDEPIYLIVGGRGKDGDDYSKLDKYSNIKKIYAYGENKNSWKNAEKFETLEQATLKASNDAIASKGIVLFSPAAASFDQYKNFEERGRSFKAIVNKIQN